MNSKNYDNIPHRSSRGLTRNALLPEVEGKTSKNKIRSPIDNDFYTFGNVNLFPYFKDSLYYRICGDKRCKTCIYMHDDHIDNNSSNTNNIPIFCKTKNAVYLIVCGTCGIHYVGQTGDHIHKRINNHRADIKKFTNKEDKEFLHFQSHSFDNIKLKIIAIENCLDKRIAIENLSMLHYKSLFPYGLNDLFNGQFASKMMLGNCIYKMFDLDVIKHVNLNSRNCLRGDRGRNTGKLDFEKLFNDMCSMNVKDIIFNLLRMNKSKIKAFYTFCIDKQRIFNWLDILRDICLYRLNFIPSTNCNDKTFCIFKFQHKIFDKINCRKVFDKFIDIFPLKNKIDVKFGYSYNVPIGRRIFNYKDIATNFHSYTDTNLNCVCDNPDFKAFVNDHYGHVLTGDLCVVGFDELKDLMSRGCNYRIGHKLNINHMKKQIFNDLVLFSFKLAYRYNIPISFFHEWICKMSNGIKKQLLRNIYHFRKTNNKSTYYNTHTLNQQIKELQKNFVITPVDKANNNYAIICKRFYYLLLKNELSNSKTYNAVTEKMDVLIKKLIAFNKKLKMKNIITDFPFIYGIPKFHKSPISFRFITSGVKSYSRNAGIVLKNLLDIICKEVCYLPSWIIYNNNNILDLTTSDIMFQYVSTFDFKNLFTSIPLNSLKDVLNSYFYKYEKILGIDEEFWKTLINFCLFNNYVYNGLQIYKQVQGIAMGNVFSNLAANLYLHYFENIWTDEFPSNKKMTILYMRYIDDLIVFSDNDSIPDFDFYPNELELSRTNNENCYANFLDLKINLVNGFIATDIFDKRNNYNFNINYLTYWDSNVSIRLLRNIVVSQLSRIKRICSNDSAVITQLKSLYHKLICNGFPGDFVTKHFSSFLKNSLNNKFQIDINEIYQSIADCKS